jgi:UDP-glucose 4-epimerase
MEIPVITADRREGDPAILMTSNERAERILE